MNIYLQAHSRIDELSKTVERFEKNMKHKQVSFSLRIKFSLLYANYIFCRQTVVLNWFFLQQETISLLEKEIMRWKIKESELSQIFAKEKSRREEAEE